MFVDGTRNFAYLLSQAIARHLVQQRRLFTFICANLLVGSGEQWAADRRMFALELVLFGLFPQIIPNKWRHFTEFCTNMANLYKLSINGFVKYRISHILDDNLIKPSDAIRVERVEYFIYRKTYHVWTYRAIKIICATSIITRECIFIWNDVLNTWH